MDETGLFHHAFWVRLCDAGREEVGVHAQHEKSGTGLMRLGLRTLHHLLLAAGRDGPAPGCMAGQVGQAGASHGEKQMRAPAEEGAWHLFQGWWAPWPKRIH